jgi:flagellar export protein FliJ
MKPFQFRLERVLEWRRRQAEMEEMKLGQSLAEAQRLETERQELATARRGSQAEILESRSLAASDLWMLGNYLKQAARADAQLAASQSRQKTLVEARRAAAVEAQRRCEALERLKQMRSQEWSREIGREMDAFASEAFLARWKPPSSS